LRRDFLIARNHRLRRDFLIGRNHRLRRDFGRREPAKSMCARPAATLVPFAFTHLRTLSRLARLGGRHTGSVVQVSDVGRDQRRLKGHFFDCRGGACPARALYVPAEAAGRRYALARLLDPDATEITQLAIGLRNGKGDVADPRRILGARPVAVRAGQDADTSGQRDEGRGDRDAARDTQACRPSGDLERTLRLLERRRANEVGERTHVLCEAAAFAAPAEVRCEEDPLELRELAVHLVGDPRPGPCAVGLVHKKPAHLPIWT
jgi:hypothetical protein